MTYLTTYLPSRPAPILDSLTKEMRFEKPSEVQASTLPLILDNESVIAQAQSGAGKTIAFAIGMLAKVDVSFRGLQALCLAPTRELVHQIVDHAIKPLSSRMPGITYEKALPGNAPYLPTSLPPCFLAFDSPLGLRNELCLQESKSSPEPCAHRIS